MVVPRSTVVEGAPKERDRRVELVMLLYKGMIGIG